MCTKDNAPNGAIPLHPDIDGLFPHLFNDVATDPKFAGMTDNIGKTCTFTVGPNSTLPEFYRHEFVIGGLQRNYRGDPCYRVYRKDNWDDGFGAPAQPKEINIHDKDGDDNDDVAG